MIKEWNLCLCEACEIRSMRLRSHLVKYIWLKPICQDWGGPRLHLLQTLPCFDLELNPSFFLCSFSDSWAFAATQLQEPEALKPFHPPHLHFHLSLLPYYDRPTYFTYRLLVLKYISEILHSESVPMYISIINDLRSPATKTNLSSHCLQSILHVCQTTGHYFATECPLNSHWTHWKILLWSYLVTP